MAVSAARGLAAVLVAAAFLLFVAPQRPAQQPLRVRNYLRAAVVQINTSKPTLLNLDERAGVQAAAALAINRELIVTTSDWNGIGSAINLAKQLERFSLNKRLLLVADKQRTCKRTHAVWPWLACGYSAGIPGFERYASTGVVEMWSLWSAKWLVLARLVELELNVMMMDSDMLVLSDPYGLLHSPPLDRFTLLLPPEGARVNVGYVYARGANAKGGGLASMLWDVVRRLRLFLEQTTLRDRRGAPSVQGLWDQGIFSDAIISAVVGEYSYAFTWLHSPASFASGGSGGANGSSVDGGGLGWPPAGFTNSNATALLARLWHHPDSERILSSRPAGLFPTLSQNHPQRRGWSASVPLLWNRLYPLNPTIGIAPDRLAARPDLQPGWLARAPWMDRDWTAVPSRERASTSGADAGEVDLVDLVAAAPDWLHCTSGHWMMTAGWLSADRPVCAILHLVECRSQFAHYAALDTLKANRPYVMRAYGHWHAHIADAHLAEAERTRPPNASSVRAVRLSSRLIERTAGASGVGVLLSALQLLGVLAALTGRVPIVPSVPCSSKWFKRHHMTPNGIADDYVLQLPPTVGAPAGAAAQPACHLAIGGATCALPHVLPAWQRLPTVPGQRGSAVSSQPEQLPATKLPLRVAWSPNEWASVQELRIRAFRLRDVAVLEVDADDVLAPISAGADRMADRFRCGVPMALAVNADALGHEEARRLRQLRRSCPAFFAPPGSKRRQLGWLHRRRRVRADGVGCDAVADGP